MVTLFYEFFSSCSLVLFCGGETVEEALLFICSMMVDIMVVDIEEDLIEIQKSILRDRFTSALEAFGNLFSMFFFLVWAFCPPQRRKCRGVIFQEKKIYFYKKLKIKNANI